MKHKQHKDNTQQKALWNTKMTPNHQSIMKYKQHKDNLAATQTQSHPNGQIGKYIKKIRSFMDEDDNKQLVS